MSGQTPSRNESRLLELLADRALCGLSDAEQRELEALCREHLASPSCPLEYCELDAVAAEVAAEIAGGRCPALPASVRQRLDRAADQWCAAQRPVAARIGPATPAPASPARTRVGPAAYLGWLAAAASLALAIFLWRGQGSTTPSTADPVARRAQFKAQTADLASASWGPFNDLGTGAPPEQPGVSGSVEWSESRQTGFITFKGLKPNDPRTEQYQLWIVDSRGLNQRISGALFDAKPDPGTGEVVVPIEPRIAVDKAAIFAVTIEKPGGVWVSDMSRRVVLAQLTH